MPNPRRMQMATAGGVGAGGFAVWGWGRGDLGGTLDNSATVNRSSPVQMTDKNFSFFFAGGFTNLAINSSDELWIWGRNNWGQIGDGSQTDRSSPVQIAGAYSRGAFNSYTSLLIKTDGTLWASGRNQVGTLGQGDTTNVSSPVQVGSDTDWAAVAISNSSTVAAIKTGGTLYTWGEGSKGELGDGSTTDRSSPVQIGSNTDWIKVAGNMNDTAGAVTSGGTLFTWGVASQGMLANGTTSPNLSSPVQVGSATDWLDISGFGQHFAASRTA